MSQPTSRHTTSKRSVKSLFPATQWTRIRRASEDGDAAQMALEQICAAYWYPTFVTARTKFNTGHHEAEDLTQAFWLWVLEGGHLAKAVPERGKFRSFLMTCFEHFILHEWRKQAAQKRGGKAPHVSIQSEDWNDRFEREMGASSSPAEHLERAWEDAALEVAFREVEHAWAAKQRGDLFLKLKAHLGAGAERGGLRNIAEASGMSETNVRQWLFRLRKELKEAASRWLGMAD